MRNKIVYIAHALQGDITGNLGKIMKIVMDIQNCPKCNAVVPFVPYYLDCLLLNDKNPLQRELRLNNSCEILGRKGFVDEMWLYGFELTEELKKQVLVCFKNNIKICTWSSKMYIATEKLAEEWEMNK